MMKIHFIIRLKQVITYLERIYCTQVQSKIKTKNIETFFISLLKSNKLYKTKDLIIKSYDLKLFFIYGRVRKNKEKYVFLLNHMSDNKDYILL